MESIMFWRDRVDYEEFIQMTSEAISKLAELENYLEQDANDVVLQEPYELPEITEVDNFLVLAPNDEDEIELPGFTLLSNETFPTSIVLEQTTIRGCSSSQNNRNLSSIRYFNDQASRCRSIISEANGFNANTRDGIRIKRLIDEHESNVRRRIPVSVCTPTFAVLELAYAEYARLFRSSVGGIKRAVRIIYGNAERENTTLENIGTLVENARLKFESAIPASNGYNAIVSQHRDFLNQAAVVNSFRLFAIKIERRQYSPDKVRARSTMAINAERRYAAITELDRLRQEYVENNRIRVPLPSEFTRSASTPTFSFNQLNTGSYTWALLRPALLTKLEEIASAMGGANYEVQLNSVYRNPNRSSGNSRHQFGDAVDLQVFDFNNSGGRRGDADWQLLANLINTLGPGYLEPLAQSGAGHVHADWRNS